MSTSCTYLVSSQVIFNTQTKIEHLILLVVEKARHSHVSRQLLSYKGLTHSKWAGFSSTPEITPQGLKEILVPLLVSRPQKKRMSCSSLTSPGAAASWLLWCAQHSLGLGEPPAPGLSSALFPDPAFTIWRGFVGLIHIFPREGSTYFILAGRRGQRTHDQQWQPEQGTSFYRILGLSGFCFRNPGRE